jgi:hypothetical protein
MSTDETHDPEADRDTGGLGQAARGEDNLDFAHHKSGTPHPDEVPADGQALYPEPD